MSSSPSDNAQDTLAAVKVSFSVYLTGWPELLPAFFATVAARLEPEGVGSRFPRLAELATGELASTHAEAVRAELQVINNEIGRVESGDIASAAPDAAWISDGRFVTIRGADLLDALIEAADASAESGEPMRVYSDFMKRI